MKTEKQIEALLEQLPTDLGFWHGYETALIWVLSKEVGNPLGMRGIYKDPEACDVCGMQPDEHKVGNASCVNFPKANDEEPEEDVPRRRSKVVKIIAMGTDSLFALRDDGAIFQLVVGNTEWTRIFDVPQVLE